MKKKIAVLYYAIVIVLFFYILLSRAAGANLETGNWKGNRTDRAEISYITKEEVSADVRRYCLSSQEVDAAGDCLLFYTSHYFSKVYADGELVYAVEMNSRLLGSTSGCRWNFVSIPSGTKEICVELTACYETVRGYEPVFYAGKGAAMFRYLMRNSLLAAIISLLTIAIGGALMIFWGLVHKKAGLQRTAFYLGTFALIIGLWSFGETDFSCLISGAPVTASFCAFVYLMLMTIPFVLFVREHMKPKDNIFWKVICIYSLCEMILQFILFRAGIMDLKESVIFTHVATLAAFIYMVYGWIYRMRRRQDEGIYRLNVIGIAIIGASLIADLVAYYTGSMYVDAVGRFGFFLYILIFAAETLEDAMRQIEEGRKAAYYKERASVDALTGLYNRMAFMEDVAALEGEPGVIMVTFDLNDLKKTNDIQGHAVGDSYLVDAAEIIQRTFSTYGKCYRTGGDEFFCVIPGTAKCNMEKVLKRLRVREQEYNKDADGIVMKIACGYAVYDGELDSSLQDTGQRADAKMYEDKAQLKQ